MKIVQYPHPALRYPAQPVTAIDKGLRLLAGRMLELMYESKGLGLAAPQVAVPLQLLVMNFEGEPENKAVECVAVQPFRGTDRTLAGTLGIGRRVADSLRESDATRGASGLHGAPVPLAAPAGCRDAERRGLHSHAERGNEVVGGVRQGGDPDADR